MDWMVESDRPGFNFPDISLLKDLPANTGATGEAGSIPGSGRSPRRKWQPTAVGSPMDRES